MRKRRSVRGGSVSKGDIQSVILPKSKFETEEEAVAYAKSHGWYNGTVRETAKFWRFRQFPPGSHSFKTKVLSSGVEMIVVVGGEVPVIATYREAAGDAAKLNEDGSIWLKVMDWNAELLDSQTHEPIPISEEALAAAMGAWVSPLYQDVRANIDHDHKTALTREEFDFLESRYQWGDGLYLRVLPADEELRNALLDGTVRPSPEMRLEFDENDDDIVWPTGLGLMWQGEAVSEGAGAALPPEDALELEGGKMTKDEDAGEKDEAPKKITVDIAGAENVKATLDALKAQADKQKADFDATISAQKAELEALKAFKKTAEDNNAAMEKTRREELLKKLPDDYPDKDASVKQLERDAYLMEKAKKEVASTHVKGPNFRERDNLGTEFTKEMYEKGKELENRLLGRTAPGNITFTPFEAAQNEAAAEQAAKSAAQSAASSNTEKK